jgi:hypothetical protein
LQYRNRWFNRLFLKKSAIVYFRFYFLKKKPEKFGKYLSNFSKTQFVFIEIMVQEYKWNRG